jgi:hypothetical protein
MIISSPEEHLRENYDMPRTRRNVRPKAFSGVVGRNGKGHDEARDGKPSGCRKADGKMHKEDPKQWGKAMRPKWDAASETG